MAVINTNVAATVTGNILAKNERAMGQAMERLSTGLRINTASDDAAGLTISSKMTSQILGLNQAVRNGNNAISMLQTADGAMVEVTSILQRMRELTVQSANGANTAADRTALNTEFKELEAEIDGISQRTEWNGTKMLDGSLGAMSFQIGANSDQTISITLADLNTNQGTTTEATESNGGEAKDIFTGLDDDTTASGTAETDLDSLVITGTDQGTTLTYLDRAIARVNSERSNVGAIMNRLEYAVDNLSNVAQNTIASRSRISDADYATESTELARTQIIQQAATAMLAQANQQAQTVLSLLK